MWPVIALPLGLAVRSYVVLLGLAVVVCFAIGPRWARHLEGLEPRTIRSLMVGLGLAAFAGGRAHLVVNHWAAFSGDRLAMLYFWEGMHAGGAIIALVVAALLLCSWYHIPLGRLGDGLAPTVGVGIVIARVGCFLQGCCFGEACTWPWCISFPPGSDGYEFQLGADVIADGALRSAPMHPLQLYFAAAALLASATALIVHARKRYHGQAALAALLVLSVSAATLEFLRADPPIRVYWGPLPQLEWIALIMCAACLCTLAAAARRHPRTAEAR
jgi:phosphatidylglycerol:prolipoprotein diacylglycerol transferase